MIKAGGERAEVRQDLQHISNWLLFNSVHWSERYKNIKEGLGLPYSYSSLDIIKTGPFSKLQPQPVFIRGSGPAEFPPLRTKKKNQVGGRGLKKLYEGRLEFIRYVTLLNRLF